MANDEKQTVLSELDELADNNFIQSIRNSKIYKYFTEDISSKIALITAVMALGSFFIKILAYAQCKGYLSAYSIEIKYIDYFQNYSFSEFLFQGIIFIGVMIPVSIFYLMIEPLVERHKIDKIIYSTERYTLRKRITRCFETIKDYFVISVIMILFQIVMNILLTGLSGSFDLLEKANINEWIRYVGILMSIELIIAIVLYCVSNPRRKEKQKSTSTIDRYPELKKLVDEKAKRIESRRPIIVPLSFSSIAISLFLYVGLAYLGGVTTAYEKKEFSIVEEQYAVIYQDGEHYWMVEAKECNEQLVLYTHKQKVIGIEGVEFTKKEYKEVVIN